MIVYVDVLLVINLFVNYFLLLVTKTLLHKTVRRKRLVLGAVLGSLYALVIFLPKLPNIVTLLMHLAASCLIVLAAFPVENAKAFFKAFAAFFAVNFAFAGLMLALWLGFRPNGMVYQNGAVYFDIDIKILILSSAACYLLLTLIFRLLRRRAPDNAVYDIELLQNGKTVIAKALLDTGHSLSDGFSDRPVLVASRRVVQRLADASLLPFLKGETAPLSGSAAHIRLIPYSSVRGSGVLKAFCIEEVRVPSRSYRLQNVLLALSETEFSSGEYEVLLCGDFFERGGHSHVGHPKNKRVSSKNQTADIS